MAKASRFVYKGGSRTAEDEMRRAKSAGRTFDSYLDGDATMLKLKEGESTLRILPFTWDPKKYGDSWQFPVYVHYNIGPDGGTYLCPAKMNKGECPICKARAESDDEDEQSEMRVSERRLAYVIDRDDEKAGPQVWSLPASLYKDIATRSIDKKTRELLLIDDPEEGYDLMVNREGTDKKTKYNGVEFDRDPTPLAKSEKIQQKWLDFITENPLPEMLKIYDEDYLEKLLAGKATKKDDEEEEDDERPRRARRSRDEDDEEEERPRRSRRARDEEEDEEERPRRTRRARDEEEEEEEEERPRRARRSRDEEEEEEEEERPTRARRRARDEEEEEEEDERPKTKRKSSSKVGRGSDAEEEEEEEERPRSRRRARDEEEEEEIPFEEEPEEEEETKSKKTGRLSRLKSRRGGK